LQQDGHSRVRGNPGCPRVLDPRWRGNDVPSLHLYISSNVQNAKHALDITGKPNDNFPLSGSRRGLVTFLVLIPAGDSKRYARVGGAAPRSVEVQGRQVERAREQCHEGNTARLAHTDERQRHDNSSGAMTET
jgi:hypothetical protein